VFSVSLMKSPLKYLTFIGTALVIATSSSAAFAQSNSDNNICNYTPRNKHCQLLNTQDRSTATPEMRTAPSTSSPSEMTQPRTSGNEQMTPNRTMTPSDNSPSDTNDASPTGISPGDSNNGTPGSSPGGAR
jgi:hypothetical protein